MRLLVDEDRADHIDRNFGCPVPKVTRKGGGAALPWKTDLFREIVTRAARAAVEAMAFQTRDAVDAMTSAAGVRIADLRVDGGASAMDAMLQMQADQLGVTVRRPADQETTALGAAYGGRGGGQLFRRRGGQLSLCP